jgi:hypothetical protein
MIKVVILIGRSSSAQQSNKPLPERHGAPHNF